MKAPTLSYILSPYMVQLEQTTHDWVGILLEEATVAYDQDRKKYEIATLPALHGCS